MQRHGPTPKVEPALCDVTVPQQRLLLVGSRGQSGAEVGAPPSTLLRPGLSRSAYGEGRAKKKGKESRPPSLRVRTCRHEKEIATIVGILTVRTARDVTRSSPGRMDTRSFSKCTRLVEAAYTGSRTGQLQTGKGKRSLFKRKTNLPQLIYLLFFSAAI